MSVLGRIFLAVFSLGWIAVAGGLTALAWNDEQMLDLQVDTFTVQAWVDGDTVEKVLFSLVMAVLVAIGLGGFMLAFVRKSSTGKGMLRLQQTEGGVVELPATALEALVVHALGETV